MSKRPGSLLIEDMLEAVARIERYTHGLTLDGFASNEQCADAVVRNLEIIGEAASRFPAEFRTGHPVIEWTQIIGLRHRIVHEYFGVDLEIVWQIIQHDLPTLKAALGRIGSGSNS
jgi:uncharacterized protein with HEPN domain